MPLDVSSISMESNKGIVSGSSVTATSGNNSLEFVITTISIKTNNGFDIIANSSSTNNNYLFIPHETELKLEFTLDLPEGSEKNDYYVKAQSGIMGCYYCLSESGNNNYINIIMPELFSYTNEIKFICCKMINNDQESGIYELHYTDDEESDPIGFTFSTYLYPFSITIVNKELKRYDSSYSNATFDGPNIKIEKLKLSSDNIANSNSPNIILWEESVIQTQSNSSNTFEDITLNDTIGEALFSNDGYADEETYLLSALDLSDTKFDYNFNLMICYQYPNDFTIAAGKYYYSTENFSIPWSVSPLQLVGKTKLSDDDYVYGGVSIGQNPTIKQIGVPAFECGYPAYFNGIKYGYYPNDTITFDNIYYSANGYISNGKKDVIFTLNLGTPIYSQTVTFNGTILILVEGLSITKTYTDITGIIVNQKSGIITFRTTSSSVLSSSSINLRPCSVIPNPIFTITFA